MAHADDGARAPRRRRSAAAAHGRGGRPWCGWPACARSVAVALLAPLAAFTAGQGELSQAAWLGLLPVLPLASSGLGAAARERIVPARAGARSSGPTPLVVLGGRVEHRRPPQCLHAADAAAGAGGQRHRRAARAACARRPARRRRRGARGGPVRLAAGAGGAARPAAGAALLPPLPLAAYTVVANVGGYIATRPARRSSLRVADPHRRRPRRAPPPAWPT